MTCSILEALEKINNLNNSLKKADFYIVVK